ncbi:hypothetical protein [Scytonema sp. NUACC26]|uniref:hypothetical protein n=1 Tax=Scytonema sp. NUACC26 TaxID=3140176 RepID=UPI0034DC83D2
MSPLLFVFYDDGEKAEAGLGSAIAQLNELINKMSKLGYGKRDRTSSSPQMRSPQNRRSYQV